MDLITKQSINIKNEFYLIFNRFFVKSYLEYCFDNNEKDIQPILEYNKRYYLFSKKYKKQDLIYFLSDEIKRNKKDFQNKVNSLVKWMFCLQQFPSIFNYFFDSIIKDYNEYIKNIDKIIVYKVAFNYQYSQNIINWFFKKLYEMKEKNEKQYKKFIEDYWLLFLYILFDESYLYKFNCCRINLKYDDITEDILNLYNESELKFFKKLYVFVKEKYWSYWTYWWYNLKI